MDAVKTRSLAQGEKLLKEGDPSTDLYWIRNGTLLLLKGNIIAGQVVAPNFVGELGVVLGTARSMGLIAKTPCVLDVYEGKTFMARTGLNSEQGTKFLRSLAERMEMVRDKVNEFQYSYLGECLKILSVFLSEKKMAEKKLQFTDLKNIRREVEVLLDNTLTKRNAAEDQAALYRTAKQQGVGDKYEAAVSTRFKSFVAIDLASFKAPRFETFADFKNGARFLADKIVELTKQMIACQALSLPRLDSELTLIEETLPFAAREQILKELMLGKYAKGSLDDFRRQITEFDRSIKALGEETGQGSALPLAAIAKKFELDQLYVTRLQDKWKEYLMK